MENKELFNGCMIHTRPWPFMCWASPHIHSWALSPPRLPCGIMSGQHYLKGHLVYLAARLSIRGPAPWVHIWAECIHIHISPCTWLLVCACKYMYLLKGHLSRHINPMFSCAPWSVMAGMQCSHPCCDRWLWPNTKSQRNACWPHHIGPMGKCLF